MNILFIVSFLLLILSIVSGKAFLTTQTLITEKTSFYGRAKGIIETRNMQQVRRFKKATDQIETKIAKNTIQTTPPKYFSSHRLQPNKVEMSKLSITTLFTEDMETQKLLFSVACNLLDDLYGEKDFIKALHNSHWQKDLLTEIIREGKKEGDEIDLVNVRPGKEPLASVYYKILKGSPGYDLGKKLGIAPITDFFSTETKRRKPILFYYASMPVLRAALGNEIAAAVLQKEEDRSKSLGGRRVLSEGELEQIIREKDSRPDNLRRSDELFLFLKTFIPLEVLTHKDNASQVYFYQPL